MDKVKISVIIPVYNTGIYLRKCLDSVLNQTFKEFEAVVVIDASPDDSLDIVREYQKSDDRIIIINKEVNEGLTAARNSGVAASSGDYILHLDSDDFWIDNNMLRNLYEIAEIDGCEMLAFNGYNYEDGELTSRIINRKNLINQRVNDEQVLWHYRAIYLFFFRREFIDRNNLSFMEGVSLGEDGIFVSSALVAAKNISSTSKCYYAYRRDHSSMMNKEWTIGEFIEEESSSQIIADTISANKDALNTYLFYRIKSHWLSNIAVRAMRDLSKEERHKLYTHARNNFIKFDLAFLDERHLIDKRAGILYGYFVSSDFDKIDKYIDKANCLTSASLFSVACVLNKLLKGKKVFICYYWFLRKLKKYIKNSLVVKFNWRLRNSKYKEKQFVNSEKLDDFNFSLSNKDRAVGVSAMLRVKNEERRIKSCIESIIDTFDEIVVIDNGSSDSTFEIVLALQEQEKFSEKVKIFSYPHKIARCGEEHSSTPADSVHSLAYYYNWCLSKCTYSMVCKWDADMLISTSSENRARFSSFVSDCVKRKVWVLGQFPIQTVYIDETGASYISKHEVYGEVRFFPNSPFVYFKKADLWEELSSELLIPKYYFEDVCVYEIKDVADDEFSHWTDVKFKGDRKVREYRNYMRVKYNWHKNNALEFAPLEEL